MKGLFTVALGYVAGLAVAMKYRKESGQSKLDQENGSRLDAFLDEVVDIHRSAFRDVSTRVDTFLDGVENLDDLRAKIQPMIEKLPEELEAKFGSIARISQEKRDEAKAYLDEIYARKQEHLETAKEKASHFADIAHDQATTLLADSKKKLDTSYRSLKKKLDTPTDSNHSKES